LAQNSNGSLAAVSKVVSTLILKPGEVALIRISQQDDDKKKNEMITCCFVLNLFPPE